MIRALTFTGLILLLLPMLSQAENTADTYVAGKHYTVLDTPVRTRDKTKIEVVEVFWYGCSHCYDFDPLVKSWQKSLPADVDFWLSPALWNSAMKTHAQAFYTAQLLNVGDKLHKPLFTTLIVERKPLTGAEDIGALFEDYGVARADFLKAFNSFSVSSQVNQADARARSYKISGTPELVVNGKYRVTAALAGGQAKMLSVVDFLVAQERAQLTTQ